MNAKVKKIYDALIEGAEQGLTDIALFQHVVEQCPKATSKKIVKASLFALSDPDLRDANILTVIYALAIKHRLDPVSKDDIEELGEPQVVEPAPSKKKAKSAKSAPVEATA